ncbi:MAG: RNB domain-containing ribonuclease [Aquificota bacterium]|nr:RNB domain-containing ribonuclease [Aquificota bacterium]
MENLYRILSRRRWEKGSIDFDLPEAEVIVDEYGEPTAVVPYERHIAHRIIEQFMISANETVALHLENAGYPCLYRVHEPPDEGKVENPVRYSTDSATQLRSLKSSAPSSSRR